jgi:hypothetical protein
MSGCINKVHAVKEDKFVDRGMDGQCSTGTALVMAGVAVAVCDGNRNTGYGAG